VVGFTGWLVDLCRGERGRTARPSRAPGQPLELYSFEASPFFRIARETLCDLELPYRLINVAKRSAQREAFIALTGKMQVPYLVDPNTGTLETVASGVRNSVGMDFHPKTRELWFTNHARDWVDDETPHDTLHRVSRKGMHFGYPFCHQGDFADPDFGANRSCAEFDKPVAKLGSHIAPLGMRFYTGRMFPPDYRDNIFIAPGYTRLDASGSYPLTPALKLSVVLENASNIRYVTSGAGAAFYAGAPRRAAVQITFSR
jgi:glutaredoxin